MQTINATFGKLSELSDRISVWLPLQNPNKSLLHPVICLFPFPAFKDKSVTLEKRDGGEAISLFHASMGRFEADVATY